MRRVLEAFERGDADTIRSLISESQDTLVIGSDAEEWLYGLEAYFVSSAQTKEMDYDLTIHRLDAHEEGSIGWAAADTTARFANGTSAEFRVTAVFRIEAGVWKIVQWHASVPTPINETSGTRPTTSLAQLLEELDEGLEQAMRARFQTETMTFLFSDIVESTRQAQAVGDAIWSDLVQRHFAEVDRVATAHDGVVVKTLGDGAMLVFENAHDAVRASAAIQRSVERQSAMSPFRVRVGVHTGEAMHVDGDYLGQTVNAAARLASAAPPGEVLISATTLDACGPGLAPATDLRLGLELDGISGPFPASRLVRD